MAIEEAGVPASQLLYVGDNPVDDVAGANQVGIEAILINRPGREPNTAPRMIESLLELERIVFPEG